MNQRRGRWCVAAAAIALAAWAAVATVSAHEMGSSRAHVTFDASGGFTIEVMVDPQALLAQVALDAGDASFVAADGPHVAEQVRARLATIAAGIDLRFDGERQPLALSYDGVVPAVFATGADVTAGKPGETGTLRMTGRVPDAAHGFTFAYRWTYGAMSLVVADPRGREPRMLWLGPNETSAAVSLDEIVPPTVGEVVVEYLRLGFTHIVPKGLDHILFVLGLFFLSAGWRPLLLQVTTFTVAHTTTLGLSMLGVVSLSPSIVEPLIALSIAYVAIENLTTSRLKASRLVLIFGFGLLHGLGFAGVLAELGVPASQFPAALLAFNVGVEGGQLAVIGLATLAVAGWRQRESSLLPLVARPASVVIALSGLYWTLARVL